MTWFKFLDKIELLWVSEEKSLLTGFLIFLFLCVLTPLAMLRFIFLFFYEEIKRFQNDLKYFKE